MASHRRLINGIDYQIYTWGTPGNPVIFLIHGWLDSGGGFEFLAGKLAKDYYLVAPDLRGYGLSGHTSSPLGYFFFEYVADLHVLLREISSEHPAILLGHSLGGAVASVYAAMFPERVKCLINAEGFGFQRPGGRGPVARARDWLEGMPPKSFATYPDLESFAKRLMGSNPRLPLKRARVLANFLARPVEGGYRMAADPAHRLVEPYPFPQEVMVAFWAAVTAPSLFIWAEASELGKWFSEINMEQTFPKKCLIQSIPDCGHMIHHEKPELLSEMVRKFLASSFP
jgi:pimeloyl-ACP methyl ester carboxylesterase